MVFSLDSTTSNQYFSPTGIIIDSFNGVLQLRFPTAPVAINIKIEEFRNGLLIVTTFREMLMYNEEDLDIAQITQIEHL